MIFLSYLLSRLKQACVHLVYVSFANAEYWSQRWLWTIWQSTNRTTQKDIGHQQTCARGCMLCFCDTWRGYCWACRLMTLFKFFSLLLSLTRGRRQQMNWPHVWKSFCIICYVPMENIRFLLMLMISLEIFMGGICSEDVVCSGCSFPFTVYIFSLYRDETYEFFMMPLVL